jgi:hypothetical protein
VGAYLYQIGITDFATISYLTSPPPTSIMFLKLSEADAHRIDVQIFSLTDNNWAWARTALSDAKPLRQNVSYQRHICAGC